MKGKIRRFYSMMAVMFLVIFSCMLTGCAGTVKSTGAQVEQQDTIPPPQKEDTKHETEPDIPVAEEPYDLESEMPEDDSVGDKDERVESIDPVKADSFSVEESVEPSAPTTGYDLGYRIQLAAFAESAGARDFKKKVMAATGITVYIDYEEGLYKVRAGDFSTRAEASEARSKLESEYPDCWIVRTTILKAR